MILKLLLPPSLVRHYRPSVSPVHQEKILAIRSELAALGVATGRNRAKRNGMSSGTTGIGMKEAIEKLRENDLKRRNETGDNKMVSSLILNVQVKLLKEQ